MSEPTALQDRYSRRHEDLRVSITDRCNLRCLYCLPVEPVWFPRRNIIRYEEILQMVRLLTGVGLKKVRITGGEPLVRRNLPALFRMLSEVPGLEDLSLTTNGILLPAMAAELAGAGLERVNVSLETLSAERFKHLTGKDLHAWVLDGLEAAVDAGLGPIKVNTVLIRGFNDDEILDLAGLARKKGWELRFIEFMPLENGVTWDPGKVVSGREAYDRVNALYPLEEEPIAGNGTARRFAYRDGAGTLGFINGVSEPFCSGCSRLRLTADGKLRPCLHEDSEVDLASLLRSGATDDLLLAEIRKALSGKRRAPDMVHGGECGCGRLDRTMHQIGG